ncbi:hypothetical protein GETHLI_35750 [Geothrix limicola]|uniref:Zinc ribbon domain-containing protein n=1 Tax=Geothrix limicola TaxID=2927978 RepID=A0ABQ5QK37_9BACT|nr:hypothetical protein GETHLI_35750 [Geothrix limicola]
MDYFWSIVGAIIGVIIFWVVPIWLGIRIAHKRNRSALWMWFGVHPLGGWITYAVLACLPTLKNCPQCAEKVKENAKVCHFCQHPFDA